MAVTIVADRETHLLISRGDRFAIIERRNNRLYSCHDGKRDGVEFDDIADVGSILHASDWTDKASAQAAFDEIVATGTQLSERMR